MARTELMNKMTRSLNRVGLSLKKHSPEILVGAGIVGVVASSVMACKATLKIDDVLAESKDNAKKINNYVEETGYSDRYTETDHKRDLTITYAKGGMELIKLYAPSIALGTLSIAAIIGGHHILRKRNVAIAAAYATLDKGFKDYRGRVIERFGKDLDRELKYDIKEKEVEERVVNEDGTETTVKKNVQVATSGEYGKHSKFFDASCSGFTKDPEFNLMFLRNQQEYANKLLRIKGHMFVNEVWDLLGIQRTKEGQLDGWIYDPNVPEEENQIDFGIFNIYKEANRRFVNGYEPVVLLDLNAQTNILDNM